MGAGILFVCTGNICRSPFAAAYTTERLGSVGLAGFAQASSSGSQALVGASCPRPLTERVVALGIDLTHHVGRALDPKQVEEASLVLGLGREHRRAAIKAAPRAARYSFTLREFARLVAAEAPESDDAGSLTLESFVQSIAARRGTIPLAAEPLDDDVVDPYGHDGDVYDESVAQIVEAVDSIVAAVRAT
jgi:protein-tyrosine phosphatase